MPKGSILINHNVPSCDVCPDVGNTFENSNRKFDSWSTILLSG